eukprot:gene7048-7262_t
MYQRYDLATAQVSALQELTDEAIDAAITPTGHASLFDSQHSRKAADVQDPEAAGSDHGKGCSARATSNATLADWRLLQSKLDSAGSLACQNTCCGQIGLGKQALQQQAASQLQQLSAFVAAHTEAQKVVDEHLVRLHSANPGTDDAIKLPQHKQAAQQVLQESKDEVAAALTYAHEGLLPKYPTLGPWLMSKHVAVDVLGEQLAFLHTIEAAGLIRGEEIHAVQHNVSHKLEQLHQQRLPKSWSDAGAESTTSASFLQQDEPVGTTSSVRLGELPAPGSLPQRHAGGAADIARSSLGGPSSNQQGENRTASINIGAGLEFLAPLRTGVKRLPAADQVLFERCVEELPGNGACFEVPSCGDYKGCKVEFPMNKNNEAMLFYGEPHEILLKTGFVIGKPKSLSCEMADARAKLSSLLTPEELGIVFGDDYLFGPHCGSFAPHCFNVVDALVDYGDGDE